MANDSKQQEPELVLEGLEFEQSEVKFRGGSTPPGGTKVPTQNRVTPIPAPPRPSTRSGLRPLPHSEPARRGTSIQTKPPAFPPPLPKAPDVDRDASTTIEHVDLKELLGGTAYNEYKAGAYRTPKPAPASDPAPDSSDGVEFDDSFQISLETTPTATYEGADKTPTGELLPKSSKPRPPLYTPATCTPSNVRAVQTSKSVMVPSPVYTTPADPSKDQNRIKTIPPPTVAKEAIALNGEVNPYRQPIWMQYTKQRGWTDWIPFIVLGLIFGGALLAVWKIASQNQDRRKNAPQQEQVEQKSYCPDCPSKNGYYGF